MTFKLKRKNIFLSSMKVTSMTSSQPKTTKTYFITRDYENKFPPEFVSSRNDR